MNYSNKLCHIFSYFSPACFKMLFNVPFGISLEG